MLHDSSSCDLATVYRDNFCCWSFPRTHFRRRVRILFIWSCSAFKNRIEVGHFVKCDLSMWQLGTTRRREFSRVDGSLHEKTRSRVLILKLGSKHSIFSPLSFLQPHPPHSRLSSLFGSSLPLVYILHSLFIYFPLPTNVLQGG
jgi:hypothetical protein